MSEATQWKWIQRRLEELRPGEKLEVTAEVMYDALNAMPTLAAPPPASGTIDYRPYAYGRPEITPLDQVIAWCAANQIEMWAPFVGENCHFRFNRKQSASETAKEATDGTLTASEDLQAL